MDINEKIRQAEAHSAQVSKEIRESKERKRKSFSIKKNTDCSNFSINANGEVEIRLKKQPENWRYVETPYGTVLKMPLSDYETKNPEWGLNVMEQAERFGGYIFVIPQYIPKNGYKPVDFYISDKQLGDYILYNVLGMKEDTEGKMCEVFENTDETVDYI